LPYAPGEEPRKEFHFRDQVLIFILLRQFSFSVFLALDILTEKRGEGGVEGVEGVEGVRSGRGVYQGTVEGVRSGKEAVGG
jgi:hypothetical protein